MLRVRELVSLAEELLAKIAEFIGVSGAVALRRSVISMSCERHLTTYFGSGEPERGNLMRFGPKLRLRAFYTLRQTIGETRLRDESGSRSEAA